MSPGPNGTHYGSLIVINHRRVSISTQCLPRVSNSHSLTVSSTVAFLRICPLLCVAPTWTLHNLVFFLLTCVFHFIYLFFYLYFPSNYSVLFFLHCIGEEEKGNKGCSVLEAKIKRGEDLKLTFRTSSHSPYFSLCSRRGCCLLEKPITVSVECEQHCLLDKNIGFNCIRLSWVLTSCAWSGVVTVCG